MANVVFGASTTNLSFNNAAGLNNTTITVLSQVGINDAFTAVKDPNQIGSPGSVGKLFISEVAPWSSTNSPVGADWFEVTNTKAVAVDITGWKIDDDSQTPVAAVALNGITSINPGESVIFIETNDLATKSALFLSNWFGSNPPAGLKIGNYTGSGIGLGSGGDQVNLYDASGSNIQKASIWFGASPTTTFATFDNSAGVRTNITQQTKLSAVGVNGAFVAANSANEIGSPGVFKIDNTLSVKSPELFSSFKVIAYPVPSTSTFQLDLTTFSNDSVDVKVYDMNGKLVEARQFDANEIKEQQLGNNYSTGIYNIIVTQGENTKTLRVIKK